MGGHGNKYNEQWHGHVNVRQLEHARESRWHGDVASQEQRSPTLPLTPQEPPLAMPLVLYRIVDVFDGLERNEDGDYEDGYSRIQTRELIEWFSLKSLPGHRGHRSDRRSSRLSARARMPPESSSGTIAKGLGGHP